MNEINKKDEKYDTEEFEVTPEKIRDAKTVIRRKCIEKFSFDSYHKGYSVKFSIDELDIIKRACTGVCRRSERLQ